jgi:hypothetical protein
MPALLTVSVADDVNVNKVDTTPLIVTDDDVPPVAAP